MTCVWVCVFRASNEFPCCIPACVYSVVELSMSFLSFSRPLSLSPGSASFHSSMSNKEENIRDTAPVRKQDINAVY